MTNDMNGLHDLPEGWVWTTIGECGIVITGNTPPKNDPSNYGGYLPLVKPPELTHHIIYQAEDGLSEKGAQLARVLPPGSVMVSCIGNLGKTGLNAKPVAFNQQINAVVLSPEVAPRYVFYYFQTAAAKDYLESVASATTVAIVNKSKFQRTPIPLAPLPEQHRIVTEIEKQFTRLDAGVAALKRAQANLKRYKAAVLKAACEGKLVAQDSSDEPAAELLKRILAERRAKWEADLRAKGKDPKKAKYEEPESLDAEDLPVLPDKWCWTQLGSLFPVTIGGTPSRQKEEYWNGDVPWVSSGEVRNERIKATREMITAAGLENSNAKLHKPGIVLLAMIGEGKTRGQAAILDIPATTNQNIASILCSETPVSPEWIFYWLMSRYEQTRKSGSGGMQYALNSERIRGFAFPLPPLAEQRRIVADVERRLSVVQELEGTLAANLARVERLRQSILKRAFEGRL